MVNKWLHKIKVMGERIPKQVYVSIISTMKTVSSGLWIACFVQVRTMVGTPMLFLLALTFTVTSIIFELKIKDKED